MSPRKRKNSPTAETSGNLSKRAKVLSELWKSQEEAIVRRSSSGVVGLSSPPSGPVYRIKGIIGERDDDFLIDWADDPITGERFTPGWQPKRNVNTAAIKAWEAKQSFLEISRRSPTKISRRQRRRLRATSAEKVTAGNPQSRDTEQQITIGTNSSDDSAPRQIRRTAQIHPPSLETSNLPNLTVRLSERRSLDRDLYIAYQSSLPTQGDIFSRSQHPTSALGAASPPANSIFLASTGQDIVVPDSQALPGSSSYRPTSSTSSNVICRGQPRLASSHRQHNSSRDSPAETRDIIRGSSEIVILDSQQSFTNLRRSYSAPIRIGASSTISSLSEPASSLLPRSASDPGQTSQLHEASPKSEQIQVPRSSEKGLPSSIGEASNTDQSLVFQTQISLASVSQGSRVAISSIDLSQESKVFSRPNRPDSQPASAIFARGSGNSKRSRSTIPETFVISEDHSEEHPSQATTTDDSVLSIRSPNSQPSRPIASGRENSDHQIFFESKENSVLRPATGAQDLLLRNLDSRESPQPPSHSGDEPSDLPMEEANAQGGFQSAATRTLSVRERLRQNREKSRAETDARMAGLRAERQRLVQAEAGHPSALPNSSSQSREAIVSPVRSPAGFQPPAPQTVPAVGPLSPGTYQNMIRKPQSPDTSNSYASKSPSVIPERVPYQIQEEPSRLETQPLELSVSREGPLPVRGPQSVPHTPITPSKLAFHKEVSLSPETNKLDVINLEREEYIVPLAMQPRIQQQYCATINYYASTIKKFAEDKNHKRETIEKLNFLLDEVSKVTAHIDLQGSGPSSQEDVDVKTEAAYAESCSEKFVFLGDILDLTRDDDLHIAVVARPGPLLDIIETVLKAKEVLYTRPEKKVKCDASAVRGCVEVTLIASHKEGETDFPRAADLVISFDETFQARDPRIISLRTHPDNTDKPSPVVRLIVYASVEHIDLCLSRNLDTVERFRRLIFSMLQTQKRIGELAYDEPLTPICAEEVYNFIRTGSEVPWPLPSIQPIYSIAFMESDSSLSDARSDVSDEYKPEGKLRYWPNPVPPRFAPEPDANGKRPFDLEWGDSLETQAKKQKLGARMYAGIVEEVPERNLPNLEKWLDEARSETNNVRQDLARATALIENLEHWATRRQNDYEVLRQKQSDIQSRCDGLEQANTTLIRERETLQTQLAAAKVERTKAEDKMEAEIQKGLNHADPEIRARFEAWVQYRDLQAENAAQKKKIASLTTDFEFTRQQYQNASNVAAESAAEIADLTEKILPLQKRKEADLAHWHAVRAMDVNEPLRKEIQNLRETLKMREARLYKVEGENVELKRGRGGVQTRGSSVQPRSPRGGSRGASPVPGPSLLGQGLRPGRLANLG